MRTARHALIRGLVVMRGASACTGGGSRCLVRHRGRWPGLVAGRRLIAFAIMRARRIYVVRPTGRMRRLFSSDNRGRPRLSPDGKALASPTRGIYVLNVKTQQARCPARWHRPVRRSRRRRSSRSKEEPESSRLRRRLVQSAAPHLRQGANGSAPPTYGSLPWRGRRWAARFCRRRVRE
jgi:hypothetical protein